MNSTSCVFCQIANGKIPANKIYEDDHILAFLDIQPTTVGHALVITKHHYDHFLSTPKEEMHWMMNVAQRIGQIQMTMLNARGVNILTNAYPAAGQTVPHVHIHVIPRYSPDDRLRIEMLPANETMDHKLPLIAEQLVEGLKQ
jgi:histidine triad (HIT) family protein